MLEVHLRHSNLDSESVAKESFNPIFCAHLDKQSALPLLQAVVCSQDLVCWLWVVFVCGSSPRLLFQLFLHSPFACFMTQVFSVVCKWYIFGCVTFGFPWLAPECCLTAFLAALSAASFPVRAGTHLISTGVPLSLCSLSISASLLRRCTHLFVD